MTDAGPAPHDPQGPRPIAAAPATVDTRELFGDAREITIHHEGALYRLRITRNAKLILTK